MRYLFLSFIFTLGAFVNPAKASMYNGNYLDQMIYNETKEVCVKSQSGLRTIFNTNTVNSFLISAGQSLSLLFSTSESATSELKSLAQSNMLGVYASNRLNSIGFITAVNECFQGNSKLKARFVLSMIAADNVGKIPAIYSLIYLSRFSAAALVQVPQKLAVVLKISFFTSALLVAILEVRKQLENSELTEYEKARVDQVTSGMRQNVQVTGSLVTELAKEEIENLEKLFETTHSQKEKDQIRRQIDKIKSLLKDV